MWKKRLVLAVIALIVLASGLWCLDRFGIYSLPVFNSGTSSDKIISPVEMKEDLDFIVTTLKDVHPKTYKGLTSEQQQIIAQAYGKISNPMKLGEFYFVANEIVSSMKDAHTSIRINNNSANRIIKLNVLWLSDGMYVGKDSGSLKKGDRIVSIGGKDEAAILSDLSKIIPAENPQWVKVLGSQYLISEPYLRQLELLTDDKVRVAVKREQMEITEALPLTRRGIRISLGNKDWVSFSIDKENSLGIFTLDQCKYNDKYKKVLQDFFSQVSENNIQNVAVDVRNNGGGNSMVVDEFIRYLDVDKYLSYTGDVRYSQQAHAQRPDAKSYGYESYPAFEEINRKIEDNKLLFKGNVYILTSPGTFSSANWFAVIFKDNKLGKIIGEPTGNQPSSYGDILSFTSPNTGLSFSVSFKKWVRPDTSQDPEDSLHPDIAIYSTIEDILTNRDAQIEGLKEIIKNSN